MASELASSVGLAPAPVPRRQRRSFGLILRKVRRGHETLGPLINNAATAPPKGQKCAS